MAKRSEFRLAVVVAVLSTAVDDLVSDWSLSSPTGIMVAVITFATVLIGSALGRARNRRSQRTEQWMFPLSDHDASLQAGTVNPTKWRKVLKFLGISVLALLAIGVVLGIVLVADNLHDDNLHPEVAKLLATSPSQIDAADNGYFAWIGAVGPDSELPHAWGRRWFSEVLIADKESANDMETKKPAIEIEKGDVVLLAKDIPCGKLETCLQEIEKQPSAARIALAKGRTVLERGDTAIAFPAYQEAWRPNFSYYSPLASYPSLWRQLSAIRFALAVAENRHDEGLGQIGKEMAFHIRQMQGAVTLLEKLIALAYLRGDYMLLNEYLVRQPTAARRRAEKIATLLALLPAETTGLASVLRTECRAGIGLFLSIKGNIIATVRRRKGGAPPSDLDGPIANFFALPLFLPNASANEFYGLYRPVLAVDGKDGEAYRQALTMLRRQSNAADIGVGSLALRNPIGHRLVLKSVPNVESYFLRRDDLLTLRKAVAWQLDLVRHGVTNSDAVGKALPSAGLAHPYTGEDPTWDAETRTLTFTELPERKNKALSIHL